MKTVALTNEELNYLDNLIIEINSKLGLIKNDESLEDGIDGGLRGLLFFIQAHLSYPESEEGFINDDGRKVILTSTIEFSNEQIFFIIKILEDEAFKNKKNAKKIIGTMIKKFEKIRPSFIGE